VKIVKAGVQDEELTRMIKANIWLSNLAMGGLRAQIAFGVGDLGQVGLSNRDSCSGRSSAAIAAARAQLAAAARCAGAWLQVFAGCWWAERDQLSTGYSSRRGGAGPI
jgi:hypothetical protein